MNMLPAVNFEAKGRVKTIQGLRAIAAIAVVLFHSTVLWQDRFGVGQAYIFGNGNAGVDLFFVISGFIILYSGRSFVGSARGATRFLVHRLLRLVPIYWIATSLKLAFVLLLPAAMLVNSRPTAWHILASYLFIPSANSEGGIVPVLIVGWTLSFEMFFYVFYALTLRLAIDPLLFLLPVFTLLSFFSLIRTGDWPSFTSLASPLLLEFCFGMMVATIYDFGWLKRLSSLAGLALFVVGISCLFCFPAANIWSRTFGWGVASVCALGGALVLEEYFVGTLSNLLLLFGEASYSVYLIHGFVLPVVGFAVVRLQVSSLVGGVLIILAATCSSLVAGVLIHIYVERPLISSLRRLYL